MSSLRPLIPDYIKRLEAAGIRTPKEDIEEIVRRVIGWGHGEMIAFMDLPLNEQQQVQLEKALQAREKRIPIVRIFGTTPFCGLTLQVKDHVFRPYPESEDLVEHALMMLKDIQQPLRIVDIGTGSGNILLALLHALPTATGLGIDIAEAAIEAANANAVANNLQDRVTFRLGNWGRDVGEKFDFVVSNPPRVATADMPYLTPEMRNHDPALSLDGGDDGIKYYKYLAEDFGNLAKPGALGLFQIGPKYAEAAAAYFLKAGFRHIEFKPDYIGRPCSIAVFNR